MDRDFKFVAFDVETTGISKTSRVVEIAAVRFDLDYMYEDYQTLVDPLIPMPWGAQRVHGISDFMLEGQPQAREALEGLLSFINKDDILIAHYAEFDVSIIAAELRRLDMEYPRNLVVDSCRLARRFLSCSNYKLDTLRDELGMFGLERHRAHSDCLAVLEVVRACLKADDRSGVSVQDLLQWGLAVRGFGYLDSLKKDMPTDKMSLLNAFINNEPIEFILSEHDDDDRLIEAVPKTFYWYKDELYMEASATGCGFMAVKVDNIALFQAGRPRGVTF